ncbi:hypothetical protein J2X63_002264 [Agromyces sp. 3263]|uniref:hypothetical protein n=1 Tax=Agromyces sp. 3263 TaxID=2817750 RepID=UPI00285C0A66|nr:hypothetical protein [Agromyces sp. 3263]MDR6906578.1 hypothetical protein [Agromyces sp. 3263]
MNATERRIRELQRIAYGADATDEERAEAMAELEDLSRRVEPVARAEPVERVESVQPGQSIEDAEAVVPGDRGVTRTDAARCRLVRWTAVAASVGLLVGGALGWSTAQRVPATSSSSSRFGIVSTPEPGVPVEDTRIPQLFDRLPLADEAARIAGIDDSVDPASVRLVASRTDGPSAFVVRAFDGADVCLVLAFPTGPFRRECTTQGIFPLDGLSVEYGPDGYGLAVARLSTAGTVSLGLIVP